MRHFLFLFIIFLFVPSSIGESYQSFWHIAHKNDSWAFESPSGQRLFVLAVNTVQPFQIAQNGPDYRSGDFNGDYSIWTAKTTHRLLSYGFTGVGAWSHPSLYPFVPHGIILDIAKNYPNIDSQLWESQVDSLIKESVKPSDTELLGYWLDNELPWDTLQPFALKYFQTTSKIIRKYDPNHAILGVRFNHPPPDAVLLASKGCVDAHSFNIYSNNPELWDKEFERAYRIVGVPCQISEFSFFSDDNRSGDKNTKAYAGKVASQKERAEKTEEILKHWAKNPILIGADFFQWNDEPPGGRIMDGEDCNYGLVDIYDNAYPVAYTPKHIAIAR